MNVLISYQSGWWNAPAYNTVMIIQSLLLKGHKVFFVGKNDSPAANRIKDLNVEMINIDLYSSPVKFISSVRALKEFIIKN
ncbi:MAG: hypothetical protein R3321_11290, partial [Nitrososphaeraceae archaeon]|nr:hypothetical protein [Nitrososphaeraceae archaeon]